MRVFIEGVLFPRVSAVTVNCSANEVATATITVPPAVNIQFEAFARARVHVFYSDVEIRRKSADDQWPLLFEGEIVGDGFHKSPMGRSLILRCSGYHTYFQQVLLSYYDPSNSDMSQIVSTGDMTMFLGNQEIKLDVPVAGANLESRLTSRFSEDIGRRYASTVSSVFGEGLRVNHFYEQTDALLKLAARFLSPKDDRVEQLVAREHLVGLINNDVSSTSGRQSLMDTLKNVLSVMRYQILVNPQPRLIPKSSEQELSPTPDPLTRDRERAKSVLVSSGVKDDVARESVSGLNGQTTGDQVSALVNNAFIRSQLKKTKDETESVENDIAAIVLVMRDKESATGHGREGEREEIRDVEPVLGQFLTLPDTRFAAIPRCNVIFPRDQTSLALERDLLAEPTRMFVGANLQTVPFNRVYMAPSNIGSAVAPESTVTPAAAVNSSGYSAPVVGEFTVTSSFGNRIHPVHKDVRFHKGIDIGSSRGEATEIRSVAAGKVVVSELQEGAGEFVVIDHGNGSQSRYMHMVLGSRTVKKGDSVEAGKVIGRMGKTGRVTGVHLHFEWLVSGTHRDPLAIIRATSEAKGTTPAGKLKFVGRAAQSPVSELEESSSGQSVDAPEVTMAEDIEKQSTAGGQFEHWRYLTPEEQVKGIVPVFDNDIARAHTGFQISNPDGFDAYMQAVVESEFLWRRYMTRSMPGVDMPFNPSPVAGFPALIVDNHRSIIGMITGVSHTISVGGGSGNATTSVSIAAPRFWDEGDPYFWRNGESSDENRSFPVYYLDALVPTNSGIGYTQKEPWPEGQSVYGREDRDVDALYRLLLGCPSIPYEYGSDQSIATGMEVAVNLAIDGSVDEDGRGQRTLVGHYQSLSSASAHDADVFVRQFTAREMVNERQLMTEILGAAADSLSGTEYTGAVFRPAIQALVRIFNQALSRGGQRG
jgi:murein DD-endopeptidase MepM/ murein hydrolase activator NlpD